MTPLVSGTKKVGNLLWRQRLHWPVPLMAAAVAAAVALPAAMSTTAPAASRQDPVTYPASSWPGLLHKNTAPSQLTSSSPADLVPACASSSGGATSNQLTGLLAPTPSVTSVSPRKGPATGGTTVTIGGSGFTGALSVAFGVVPALSFSVDSDTQITATSPPGVGTQDVRVLTPGGLSAASGADQFTYETPSLPAPPTTTPTLPSQPGTTTTTAPGSTSTSPGSPGSKSKSGPTTTTTTSPGTAGSLPSNSPLTSPPIAPPGAIPSYGYGFGDGIYGCNLIDSSTGAKVAGESASQARAVQLALSFIGTPYVWGGESAHGFDCSGLVQFVYSAAGVSLPRTAQEQYDAGPAVPPGYTVVPGDLVFFGGGPGDVTHVGIFVGNGVMVDAPHTGADVRLDQINGFEPIVGVTSPGD